MRPLQMQRLERGITPLRLKKFLNLGRATYRKAGIKDQQTHIVSADDSRRMCMTRYWHRPTLRMARQREVTAFRYLLFSVGSRTPSSSQLKNHSNMKSDGSTVEPG
jgi:hypothetical protein